MQHLVETKPFVTLNTTRLVMLRKSLSNQSSANPNVITKNTILTTPRMHVPVLPREIYDPDYLPTVSNMLKMSPTVRLW
jgi:hypothetical protein